MKHHSTFSVIPVNSPWAAKYPCSAQTLIGLVLETINIMRLHLVSIFVITISAASLVSAGPLTGSTTTGDQKYLSGGPLNVCIVYAINANDRLTLRLGAGAVN